MQCPKCQATLYPGEPRCDQCGEPVSPGESPAAPPPVVAPPAEPGRPPHSIELPQRALKRALALVRYAMGPPDRPAINGLRLILAPPEVSFVATDGHRLVSVAVTADTGRLGPREMTLPRAAIETLMDNLTDDAAPVVIALSDSEALIRFGGKRLTTQFIHGQFPDFRRVVPTGNMNVVRAARADLVHALQHVLAGNGTSPRSVWTLDEGTLSIGDPDRAGTSQALAVAYRGKPMRIAFNPQYVLDTLSSLDCDAIELALGEASGPALLTMPARDDFKCVLMPIRI